VAVIGRAFARGRRGAVATHASGAVEAATGRSAKVSGLHLAGLRGAHNRAEAVGDLAGRDAGAVGVCGVLAASQPLACTCGGHGAARGRAVVSCEGRAVRIPAHQAAPRSRRGRSRRLRRGCLRSWCLRWERLRCRRLQRGRASNAPGCLVPHAVCAFIAKTVGVPLTRVPLAGACVTVQAAIVGGTIIGGRRGAVAAHTSGAVEAATGRSADAEVLRPAHLRGAYRTDSDGGIDDLASRDARAVGVCGVLTAIQPLA
jgi:hypothetical protein